MNNPKQATKRGKSIFPLLDPDAITDFALENPVCADFLTKLTDEYGYQPEQISLNVKSLDFAVGLGWAQADIVVWKSAEDKANNAAPFIVAQGKAQGGLRLEDYFAGIEFARGMSGALFVTIDRNSANFYKLDGEKFISLETPQPSELQNSKKIDDALSHDDKFKRRGSNPVAISSSSRPKH